MIPHDGPNPQRPELADLQGVQTGTVTEHPGSLRYWRTTLAWLGVLAVAALVAVLILPFLGRALGCSRDNGQASAPAQSDRLVLPAVEWERSEAR